MTMTDARYEGLRVLLDHDRARVSNTTNAKRGHVYWQTADWLVKNGLATYVNVLTRDELRPTRAAWRTFDTETVARTERAAARSGRPRRIQPGAGC